MTEYDDLKLGDLLRYHHSWKYLREKVVACPMCGDKVTIKSMFVEADQMVCSSCASACIEQRVKEHFAQAISDKKIRFVHQT